NAGDLSAQKVPSLGVVHPTLATLLYQDVTISELGADFGNFAEAQDGGCAPAARTNAHGQLATLF
ncbi:MAG: hypothetical protein U1E80_12855, partial [Piscinibacter sp.]